MESSRVIRCSPPHQEAAEASLCEAERRGRHGIGARRSVPDATGVKPWCGGSHDVPGRLTVARKGLGAAVLLSMRLMELSVAHVPAHAEEAASMRFSLTSPAFQDGEAIPAAYTCDGANRSPELAWSAPPAGTRSLALISDDPDAPAGTWVHWVVYNVPPSVLRLGEALASDPELSDGTRQGVTDFGRTGYGGPCPPSGTHRYFFKLYALDMMLRAPPGVSAESVQTAMKGHILAETQLMGIYRRKRP